MFNCIKGYIFTLAAVVLIAAAVHTGDTGRKVESILQKLTSINARLDSVEGESTLAFKRVVEENSSSVVVIYSRSHSNDIFNPPDMQPSGTGIVLDSELGLILTARHLLEKTDPYTNQRILDEDTNNYLVCFGDKKIRVVGLAADTENDLAIILVDVSDPNYCLDTQLTFGDSNELKKGDLVIVVGHPFGLLDTVTSGIVSDPARDFEEVEYLQFDAPVNPGNSGGPVFNIKGEMVGMVVMMITSGRPHQNAGLNLAIPSSVVQERLQILMEFIFDGANDEAM